MVSISWHCLCSGVSCVTRLRPLITYFEAPMSSISVLTRRLALLLAAGAASCAATGSRAAEDQIVTVQLRLLLCLGDAPASRSS
jgi:hypothetical protein